MAGRTDDRSGEVRPIDAPAATPDRAPLRPEGEAGPRADAEGSDIVRADSEPSEAEKAKTEIEAGDVADELADFA